VTSEAQYVVEQLTKLIGFTIREVCIVGEGRYGFPAMRVSRGSLTDKKAAFWIVIQSDAEGNGPGWANIEEVKGG